ncbi:MAG: ComEA family DNA-binding protein [Gammaproteobacteria bacterium]
MKRKNMAVLTVVTVALLMSWVLPALSADLQKVNINTAALEELMTLDGIGQAVAERILAFRDENGPFQKPEDLMMVKGIGSGRAPARSRCVHRITGDPRCSNSRVREREA